MKNKIYIWLFLIAALFISVPKIEAQLVKTVVALTGSVFDASSKEPVTVDIYVTDETGNKINNTRSNAVEGGYYYLTSLVPGQTYYVHIDDKRFMKEKFEVRIPPTDLYYEISRDYVVKPMQVKSKIKVGVPPFELNKTHLRFGADEILSDLASTLSLNPNVDFEIICYPDNNKDPKKNLELTSKRAESLRDYFAIKGVNPARIAVKGSEKTDSDNPPPTGKEAKGKRYVGTAYVHITSVR